MSANKMHFIVIDDSKLDCFIAEKIIQNTGRSESVKTFMTASEALDYIKAASPSVQKTMLLVDIQMPVMNGFEFLEAFENAVPSDVRNNFVINLLSSSINESDMIRAKGYKSVANFLNKPLTRVSLDKILAATA
jgi:CheY-like chemotaxis protein